MPAHKMPPALVNPKPWGLGDCGPDMDSPGGPYENSGSVFPELASGPINEYSRGKPLSWAEQAAGGHSGIPLDHVMGPQNNTSVSQEYEIGVETFTTRNVKGGNFRG